MISSKTQEIIDIAIKDGMAKYYIINKTAHEVDSEGCPQDGTETVIETLVAGTDKDEAVNTARSLAEAEQPQFKEEISCTVAEARIDRDAAECVTDDSDLASPEDLFEVARFDNAYQYQSVYKDILVFYRWEKYVNYARKFVEIREGYYSEDESITINSDKAFSAQCEIAAKASELEGLSDEEKYSLVMERLGQMDKWNGEEPYKQYVKELFGQQEAE